MYVLLGAAVGILLDDLLKATGLHWLVWPAVGLLTLAAVTGTLIGLRKRS
jgi:hypothetical protein